MRTLQLVMANRCENCGREGVLKHVGDLELESRPTEITYESGDSEQVGDPHGLLVRYDSGHSDQVADRRMLLVQRCEVCGAPTMSTYRYIDGWSDPSDFMDLQQIFPARRALNDLPARIGKRYQEMLHIQYEPGLFAVCAGRLLEAVCSDQGVTEGDLGPRLDQLAGKKRKKIPRALAEQAHLVRRFRNLGGHDDDVEVEAADVPLIREFVESLLEFLYWGPERLERATQALERRITDGAGPSDSTPP